MSNLIDGSLGILVRPRHPHAKARCLNSPLETPRKILLKYYILIYPTGTITRHYPLHMPLAKFRWSVTMATPSNPSASPPRNIAAYLSLLGLLAAGVFVVAQGAEAEGLDTTGYVFYAVDLENVNVGAHDFGIGVHNVAQTSAKVDLFAFDLGKDRHIEIDSQAVPAGGGHVFQTSSTPISGSGITKNSLYIIRSDQEIAAIQMSPLDSVESNDVAELVPQHEFGTDYQVMTFHPHSKQSFFAITAVEPDTRVTVTTTAAVLPNAGTGATPVGIPTEYTLQPTETLNIKSVVGGDLSGSNIESDKPVAVFAGAVCTRIGGQGACDTLTEQTWPTHKWGDTFVACRAPQRSTEPVTLRVMAIQPGITEVTTNPPIPGTPATLVQGSWTDLELQGDTVLSATQDVSVGEFLHGDPSSANRGDPSFTQFAPTSHMGLGMQFLIPPNFPDNLVTIAAEDPANLQWETGTAVSAWSTIPGTDYKCAREPTTSGVHTLTGNLAAVPYPFGSDPLDAAYSLDCEVIPREPDNPNPDEPSPETCPTRPPPTEPSGPRFLVRAYGFDTYGSYGFPIHANMTNPPDFEPVTYAAADLVGSELLVSGNDPGCGLGDPGSFVPARASRAQFRNPSPLSVNGHHTEPDGMQRDRFLHGAASLRNSGSLTEQYYVIGGAQDCAFIPRNDVEVMEYTPSGGAGAFQNAPSMFTPRIAPAVAPDRWGQTVFVAGGDSRGGDPLELTSWHRPTPALEIYDANSGSWRWAEDMPAGLTGSSALYDWKHGDLVVSGGASHPQVPNRLVQVYDRWSNEWIGEHLDWPLTGHQTVQCNGWPYVIGGKQNFREMYHYGSGEGVAQVGQRGLGSGFPITAPPAVAYHGAAEHNGRIIISGGVVPGAISSDLHTFDCSNDSNPWNQNLPPLPIELAEHGMEAVDDSLVVVGGTSLSTTATWTGRQEGDCPHSFLMGLDLNNPTGWQPLGNLRDLQGNEFPLASMGTAELPDGRMVIAGGRTMGESASGQFTCFAPSDKVWFYDHATNELEVGPSLPEGLIAPAVAVHNGTIYVSGGDETGDVADPSGTLEDRQRRPSTDTYALRFLPLVGSPPNPGGSFPLPTPAVGGWKKIDDAPLGVVHGQFAKQDDTLYLVAGNHHPEEAVRAVQPLRVETVCQSHGIATPPCPLGIADSILGILQPKLASETLSVETWLGAHLPSARMHHGMEYDFDGDYWLVHGGVTSGSLYFTRPAATELTGDVLYYGVGNAAGNGVQEWTLAGSYVPRAFPVGYSGNQPVMATGTTPLQHRTLDLIRP